MRPVVLQASGAVLDAETDGDGDVGCLLFGAHVFR